MDIFSLDKKYIANTYARFPLQIVKGKGSIAIDNNGKKYIDFGSGIAVNTFGYSDKKWAKAVSKQAKTFQHTSNLYYHEKCTILAEKLCEKTGFKKVFFSNSGAEANECAIKVIRKYAELKQGKDCYKIITLVNSFHGRTITTLSATGQDVFHNDFLPLTDGFIHVKAGDFESLENIVKTEKIAGVLMELVQGEGGVMPLDENFVQKVEKLCKDNDVVLAIDEVQTGNGRTGSLYAYQGYNIKPDLITTAKGLGGGLPIGATMLSEKVEDVLKAGMHGSTFGGNPVASAGAISIIDRLDEKFLNSVKEKSNYIISNLSGEEGVIKVSGKGLMLGIETKKSAKEVALECLEKGLIVLTAKNKVRLLPPLNIDYKTLKKGVEILKSVIRDEL